MGDIMMSVVIITIVILIIIMQNVEYRYDDFNYVNVST
jgi:hypothetical protein